LRKNANDASAYGGDAPLRRTTGAVEAEYETGGKRGQGKGERSAAGWNDCARGGYSQGTPATGFPPMRF